ncbi:unnamed protein product [Amoebophrya sp. A120]|nr:unnamed protein product [Amoebophrya sp. A120]|eukprot:GSA120T00012872001.1
MPSNRSNAAAAAMSKRALKKQENAALNSASLLTQKQFWYGLGFMFLVGGISIFQFGLMLSNLLGVANVANAGVHYVDVASEDAKLKEAFFGGDPHVLYCTGEKTELAPTPKVVVDLARMIQKDKKAGDTKFITANCFKPMSSGKTIAERFSFGKNEGFVAVFANEDPPVQLNYLQSAEYVAKQIKPMLKTGITKIVYKKDWDKIKKKRSFLLLGGKTHPKLNNMHAVFSPEVKNYRKTKIATVDTSFWEVNQLDEEFVKALPAPEEDSEFGTAMCVVKEPTAGGPEPDEEEDEKAEEKAKTEEEKRAEAKKAFKDGKDGKKEEEKKDEKNKKVKKYRIAYLDSWEGDAPRQFLEKCAAGGEESWKVANKRPEVRVIPSKPKVVKRPSRGGAEKVTASEDDGTKKGGKERIGRRADDEEKPEEEDDFEDFNPEQGEGEGEGEEGLFGTEEEQDVGEDEAAVDVEL